MNHPTGRRPARRRVVPAVLAMALAAAAGGGLSDATFAANTGGGHAVASGEQVVLTHWDDDTSGGVGDVTDILIAEFEAENPNIRIERTSRQFADYGPAVRLAVSGSDAPDVFTGGLGHSLDGPLVQAGVLLALDELAAETGWLDQLNDVTVAPLRFSEDGEVWGEGNLYGMTIFMEFIGVFYNREKAEALGLDVPPTTFADFESALQQAKDADETPIWFGEPRPMAGCPCLPADPESTEPDHRDQQLDDGRGRRHI